jgi:NAD(P) transhydrogenase subunit alpha
VRPETREQIQSLGGKFLDLGVSAAGEGGYARALTDDERAEQQRRLAEHLKNIDVIVCTAAVPGRPAPKIITAAMVAGMKPGSVIVDLAAETGGNCELTRPGETIDHDGVVIDGPLNLASSGALHASEMYARNVYNFASLLLKDGTLVFDWDDELLAKTVWPPRDRAVRRDGRERAAARRLDRLADCSRVHDGIVRPGLPVQGDAIRVAISHQRCGCGGFASIQALR